MDSLSNGMGPSPTIDARLDLNLVRAPMWMPGKRPHYEMEVFDTPEDARNWIDPQSERVWEEPEADKAAIVAISRGYKEGSVPARLLSTLVDLLT